MLFVKLCQAPFEIARACLLRLLKVRVRGGEASKRMSRGNVKRGSTNDPVGRGGSSAVKLPSGSCSLGDDRCDTHLESSKCLNQSAASLGSLVKRAFD